MSKITLGLVKYPEGFVDIVKVLAMDPQGGQMLEEEVKFIIGNANDKPDIVRIFHINKVEVMNYEDWKTAQPTLQEESKTAK